MFQRALKSSPAGPSFNYDLDENLKAISLGYHGDEDAKLVLLSVIKTYYTQILLKL
jgi:hypothetical protein